MNINYDDPKFKAIETEKQNALNDINNTYNNMINETDAMYQNQVNALKDYEIKQTELQKQSNDLALEQINQQKEQSNKDYLKEQKAAYVDYKKQTDDYGVNSDIMQQNGLNNTGISETSRLSMYNQYQNRVATARDVYNRAVLNYDNSMKEAMLQNNMQLAQIAFNTLQQTLELSLQGFQYKNNLLQTQLQQTQATEDRYYNKYKDVLAQMNYENELKKASRSYSYGGGGITITDDGPKITNQGDAYGNVEYANVYFSSKEGQREKQPRYINDIKLTSAGTINELIQKDNFNMLKLLSSSNTEFINNVSNKQTVWKAGSEYYIWVPDNNGKTNNAATSGKYENVTKYMKK